MNIAEILENASKGTKLYSTIFGDVELLYVNYELEHLIKVKTCKNTCEFFDKEGKYNTHYSNGECVLFPSKEYRDWSKFQVEKSCKFKPFEPVLVRDCESDKWRCNYFSHMDGENYICVGTTWNYCIPYNSTTKHLVGTNESL